MSGASCAMRSLTGQPAIGVESVRKGIVQRTPAKSLPHRLLPDFVEMNETPEVEAVVRAGGGTQLI